jgi:hypothetical protein
VATGDVGIGSKAEVLTNLSQSLLLVRKRTSTVKPSGHQSGAVKIRPSNVVERGAVGGHSTQNDAMQLGNQCTAKQYQ